MKLLIVLLLLLPFPLKSGIMMDAITQACERMKYEDCSLVKAIVKHESGYNPLSIGRDGKGSLGLMQVKCSTAQTLDRIHKRKPVRCKALHNVNTNLKYGIEYLQYLTALVTPYPTVKEVLSMYNGGYSYHKRTNTYRVKYCNAISKKKKRPCKPGELFNKGYVNMVYDTYVINKGI
jgi:soluble lytic murein transglycosylase-like protein